LYKISFSNLRYCFAISVTYYVNISICANSIPYIVCKNTSETLVSISLGLSHDEWNIIILRAQRKWCKYIQFSTLAVSILFWLKPDNIKLQIIEVFLKYYIIIFHWYIAEKFPRYLNVSDIFKIKWIANWSIMVLNCKLIELHSLMTFFQIALSNFLQWTEF